MFTTLRGQMTSEHRGSFHTAVLRLGDRFPACLQHTGPRLRGAFMALHAL